MKTLSAIRTTVRQMLRDEFVSGSDLDFQEDELDLHIADCVVEISQRRPYVVKETLKTTEGSRELVISSIEDLLEIEKLEYPTGSDPRDYRNLIEIDAATIEIDTTMTPSADEDVYLYCRKVHQLTEDSSTLPPQLESVLVAGAVAKVALGWINQVRVQVKEAVSKISDVDTAIGSMSARITQAINDLTSGRAFIGKKNAEAITAIGNMTAQITQAVEDLTTGRALIGSKKTQAETALGKISAQITQSINDLTSGRPLIAETRATADEAIDSMSARITQAITDLTAGRDLGFNKVYVGGRPLDDYANYASRELSAAVSYLNQARGYLSVDTPAGQYGNYAARDLQAARAYIEEARGFMSLDQVTVEYGNYAARQLSSATSYLNQARGYLEVDRPAGEYGSHAARELSNSTAYLNQAGGYIREISSRLSISGVINSYQTWANNKLALYRADLGRLAQARTYTEYRKS